MISSLAPKGGRAQSNQMYVPACGLSSSAFIYLWRYEPKHAAGMTKLDRSAGHSRKVIHPVSARKSSGVSTWKTLGMAAMKW